MPTITNFLVGLGFDYDGDGEKEIASGIDGLKSKALQLGAVVAGAFGIKALTTDFANANDSLGKLSKTLNVSANDITGLGRAVAAEGGSVEGLITSLESLSSLQVGLLAGEAGFLEGAAKYGVDTTELIAAKGPIEAYLALADQFKDLSVEQRIGATSVFGLSDADSRLLSQGRPEVKRQILEQQERRPTTDLMTESSAEFNNATQDFANGIGQFADRMSEEILPGLTKVIQSVNEWLSENTDTINWTIGATSLVAETAASALALPFVSAYDMLFQPSIEDKTTTDKVDSTSSFFDNIFGDNSPSSIFRDSEPMVQQRKSINAGVSDRPIEVNLNLDGQVIDKRIINTTERLNNQALDTIISSVRG